MAGGVTRWNSEDWVHNIAQTQNRAATAVAPDGTMMTVWEEWVPGRNITKVVGQIVEFDGTVINAAFDLNIYPGVMDQIRPSITALSNGTFVVAYESANKIFTQIVRPDGSSTLADPVSHTSGALTNAKVVDLGNGSYSVLYKVTGNVVPPWPDLEYRTEFREQKFDARGTAVGDNSTLGLYAVDYDFAYIGSIGEMHAITEKRVFARGRDPDHQTGTEFRSEIVLRIKTYGAPQDTLVVLKSAITDRPGYEFKDVEITALKNGHMVVTWLEVTPAGTTMRGQAVDANGNRVGSEFIIDPTTDGNDSKPVIASLPSPLGTSFVVAWVEEQGGTSVIKAQVFSAPGVREGLEFVVSTINGGAQIDPRIISHDDGRFTITWTTAWNSAGGYIRSQTFDVRRNQVNFVGNQQDDHYAGTVGNDTLLGGSGNDRLSGHDGNDSLVGGAHNDTLRGGQGNDELYGNDGSDYLQGGSGDNYMHGGTDTAADVFVGGSGTNTVSYAGQGPVRVFLDPSLGTNTGAATGDTYFDIDVFNGSSGADVFGGDANGNIFWGDAGNDTLSGYAGDDRLDGALGDDSLDGGANNDRLLGGDGNDTLNGGSGNDYMEGGAGNDTYYVDSKGDSVLETDTKSGGGTTDTVIVSFDYTLQSGTGIEILQAEKGTATINLTGSDAENNIIIGNDGTNTLDGKDGNDTLEGHGGNDSLLGGSGRDSLVGGDGDDVLKGELGDDTLIGGAGNDTYWADLGDSIGEDTSGDSDRLIATQANGEYILSKGIEYGQISAGLDGVTLSGNGFANTLEGNEKANILNGHDGNDFLYGYGGDDVLNGGNGNDQLRGDVGKDFLNGDVGQDTLWGGDDNDVINGGDDNDTLYGEAGDDILDGNAGKDHMEGGTGNDIYHVGVPGDTFYEENLDSGGTKDIVIVNFDYTLRGGSGIEILQAADSGNPIKLTGSDDKNIIWGNNAANEIWGEGGDDTLEGHGGNDKLTGGLGFDRLYGGAGDDVLKGNQGRDTLNGGDGNDTYWVDDLDDVEADTGGGNDLLIVDGPGGTYKLAEGIENGQISSTSGYGVTLIGTDKDNSLEGNEDDNTFLGGAGNDALYGHGGNDVLKGGAGNDFMSGGYGDDTYYVDSEDGVVSEDPEESDGYDTVIVDFNHTLQAGTGIEVLQAIEGNASINLTGSDEEDNVLVGNDGANKLYGRAGNDTLNGGGGNDLLDGGEGVDTLSGGEGSDTYYVDSVDDETYDDGTGGNDVDLVIVTAYGEFTLASGIENGSLAGSAGNASLNGNDGNNKLTGNDGANVLTGGEGDDTLDGGKGDDVLIGGEGGDTYYVDSVDDEVYDEGSRGHDVAHLTTGSNLGRAEALDMAAFLNSSIEEIYIDGELYRAPTNVSFTGGTIREDAHEGDEVGVLGAHDSVGDTPSFSFVNGQGPGDRIDESGRFIIVNDNGTWRVLVAEGAVFDREERDSYSFRILVTDRHGLTDYKDVTITITDVDEGPHTVQLEGATAVTVAENTTDLGVLSAVDPEGDAITGYDLSGDHAEMFEVVVENGAFRLRVKNGYELDFEMLATLTLTVVAYAGSQPSAAQEITITLTDVIEGNDGDNEIFGTPGKDVLDGGKGNDTIYGLGDDDVLIGGEGGDTLYGEAGDDTLDGGAGNDFLNGGEGSDTYIVRGHETIGEDGSEGTDTVVVFTTGAYELDDVIENGILDGSAGSASLIGHDGDNKLTGNEHANVLDGKDGDDTLIGGGGADELFGGEGNDTLNGGFFDAQGKAVGDGEADTLHAGAGNDTYFLMDADDEIDFSSGKDEGTDTVYLVADNFATDGEVDWDAIEAYAEYLRDNGIEEIYIYVDGKEVAYGKDDIYEVYPESEAIVEDLDPAKGGFDRANIHVASYTLGEDVGVEVLSVVDGLSFDVTINGNSQDNTIYGSLRNDTLRGGDGNDLISDDEEDGKNPGSGDDRLEGEAGEDTLIGGLGNDWLDGGKDNDTLFGEIGDDTLDGGEGDDQLDGGDGNDTLDGGKGGGPDTLRGGAGDDVYYLWNEGDVIENDEGGDNDTAWVLSSNIGDFDGNGVEDENDVTAYVADLWSKGIENVYVDEELYTGGGTGPENNVYHVHEDSPPIVEDVDPAIGGIDTAIIHVASYTLDDGVGVEILEVADDVDFGVEIIGNKYDNTIYGGAHDDTLMGGAGNDLISDDKEDGKDNGNGADRLEGGEGEDTLVGGFGNDWLDGGADNDTLYGGNDDDHLNGGEGSDWLDGGDGNDILDSGDGGPDTLIGGKGDDIYYLRNRGDVVEIDEGGDADTVYALRQNIGDEGTPATRDQINAYVHDLWAKGIENVWIDSVLYQKDSVPTGVRLSRQFVDELTPTDSFVTDLSVIGGDLTGTYTFNLEDDAGGRFYIDGNFLRVKNGVLLDFEDLGLYNLKISVTLNGVTSQPFDVFLGVINLMTEVVVAGNGDDLIKASSGDDNLNGGGGNDTLYGSYGSDQLAGGDGADVFVFDTWLDETNVDLLVDFNAAEDKIHLKLSIFEAFGQEGAVSEDAFTLGDQATTEAHRLIYDPNMGYLMYDFDGVGGEQAILIAVLDAFSLNHDNFRVI
ncbi:hypothetical protein [Microvirga zambiensis]|uniref:hypothetical protein n=1 Tax=Microvirga zambiensis TaxID=1402137 RepID=UPI0024835F95|nr:hypothetical protein [Microvirga zambiensis]